MADNIVSGLFGLSPFEIQQRQNAAIQQQANAYAQQSPFERATSGMYQAGAGVGQIGAGMLGMVNPEIEAAKQREAALGQVDFNTPEGILTAAKAAGERGDTRMSLQLQMLANERLNNQKKESPFAKIDPKDYTTESLQKFAQTSNPTDLVARDKTQFESMSNEEKLVTAAAKAKGLVEGTPEWNSFTSTAYQKLMDKKTNINVNAQPNVEQLTPEGMRVYSDLAIAGKLPPGYGRWGLNDRNRFLNIEGSKRYGEGGTGESVAGEQSAAKADISALNAAVKRNTGIEIGAKKIEGDIKTMQSLEQSGNLDLPNIASKPLNWARTQAGSPSLAAYALSAKQVAVEYERMMSGGMMSVAQLHEGAREDAENILNQNMTIAQTRAIIPVMLREIQNSREAGIAIENELKNRISNRGKNPVAFNKSDGWSAKIKR